MLSFYVIPLISPNVAEGVFRIAENSVCSDMMRSLFSSLKMISAAGTLLIIGTKSITRVLTPAE